MVESLNIHTIDIQSAFVANNIDVSSPRELVKWAENFRSETLRFTNRNLEVHVKNVQRKAPKHSKY